MILFYYYQIAFSSISVALLCIINSESAFEHYSKGWYQLNYLEVISHPLKVFSQISVKLFVKIIDLIVFGSIISTIIIISQKAQFPILVIKLRTSIIICTIYPRYKSVTNQTDTFNELDG